MAPHDTYLIDTTLRDGEQAPGVSFSIKEKMHIAMLLDTLGIDEVEAGTPAISNSEKMAIKLIVGAGFSFKTSSWCRANVYDILEAAKLGTDSINLSLPVSDVQINAMGKNRQWVIDKIQEVMSFAAGYFAHITMGAQDASRADEDFLNEFMQCAIGYGASRIRVSDTTGIFDPIQTYHFTNQLSKAFPFTQIEFHGHNDFGMATANGISAIQGGAKCVSATVNGLGERAGNSVLEELVAFLKYKHEVTRYNTEIISELSDYVASVSFQPNPDNKPITGNKVYTHESGIHTSALIKNRKTYQVIEPADFGCPDQDFIIGKHSGKASILYFFYKRGIQLQDQMASSITTKVKELCERGKKTFSDNDILNIYSDLDKLQTAGAKG